MNFHKTNAFQNREQNFPTHPRIPFDPNSFLFSVSNHYLDFHGNHFLALKKKNSFITQMFMPRNYRWVFCFKKIWLLILFQLIGSSYTPFVTYNLFVYELKPVEMSHCVSFADGIILVQFTMFLCPLYFLLIDSWSRDWINWGSVAFARL